MIHQAAKNKAPDRSTEDQQPIIVHKFNSNGSGSLLMHLVPKIVNPALIVSLVQPRCVVWLNEML